MGCDAQIIAIGPFSKTLLSALTYPEEQYRQVQEGTTIITTVFAACGSTESETLAQCFGVGRWDLDRHVLDPKQADLAKLRQFDDKGTDSFVALRQAGFQFYYVPNG
jgi:hypothetical protein